MWRGTTRALSALSPSAIGLRAALAPRCASTVVASARISHKVSKDVAEYWQRVLDTSVDKTTARALLPNLDVQQVLGLRVPAEGEGAAAEGSSEDRSPAPAPRVRRGPAFGGSKRGRPPLHSYFASVKKQYPKYVTLVRVGEFYETIGIDAVLLVQHAGLNPMGSGVTPRAGCPRQNLRRTVDDLVSAGLSVVVCEEAPEPYSYGSMRTRQKQRYVAAVVTPANPHLLHGLVDDDTGRLERDINIDAAPPLLALVPQVGGYTVLEVSVDLQVVQVMEGLTEDAVYARLHEGGLAPPLFLHVPASSASSDRRLSEGTFEREWEQRVATIFRSQVGVVERYNDPDWLEGLLTRVRLMLGLDAATPFTVIRASTKDRPRPLYYSTALNLGLHKARGQPCLVDYLLPDGTPLPARRWMRRLLLLPPPATTAAAVHRVCRILADLRESLPVFPLVPAASVVLKLRNREANDTFFREIGELCQALLDLLSRTNGEIPVLASSLLEVSCREMGVALTREQLQQGCATALQAIHEVVDHDTQLVGGDPEWPPELEDCCEDVREGLWRLKQANEGPFRGKVRDEVMAEDCEAVAMAADRVRRELELAFEPLLLAHTRAGEPAKLKPSIIYDSANNALWLRIPKNAAAQQAAGDLIHPHDRNGRLESSAYASHGLQSALDDYRRACYDSAAAVRRHLRELASQLQAVNTELVCAATMAVSAAALDAHTREALRRGWHLPTLAYTSDGSGAPAALPTAQEGSQAALPAAQDASQQQPFEVVDFWPYWLDGWETATVRNTLSLEGMALLTGPNMAGKSTVLRSMCAAALLGACGLYAPAASATVPYFDAFMLRTFASDSPLEGRSSFAVEMTEMRYVLEDLSPSSLVLVDELGKGTEVRAGSALAGALMEELDAARCRGIFATHLHSLVDMNLNLTNTEFLMMETAPAEEEDEEVLRPLLMAGLEEGGRQRSGAGRASSGGGASGQGAPRKPTWRIVPGISTVSLALDVARRCRLPRRTLDRAGQLYGQLDPMVARPEVSASPAGAEAQQPVDAAAAGAGGSSPLRGRAARMAKPRASRSGAGNGSSADSSPWTLAAAASTLQQVAQESLAKCTAEASSEGAGQEAAQQLQVAQYVLRGQAPAPSTVGTSCVYVLRRPDGFFYRTGHGGPNMDLVYCVLGPGAAGLAKAVESCVIRELQRRGFPMRSATDARRRHVAGAGSGGSRSPAESAAAAGS
ncbi:hypothetical protein CHLNCDRAFT_138439 [Chlorella variabilis]|uniref:DNA mismatch repair proteins mutS family domain-containing protein n=1 Tax=Chlorella variabilis TaxID=554065 RepID=E1ZN21_CHLVA|nr:hypothetical protein CHLNCDRAFT_138439 [Chlorella variabilis]EFN52896.1 hypothetical protein CHLNCDRAFT_138439 [Chlorella variabilis]|eukprot:XP_005844998.1 hypothetical protein CHLNCDRAFT_138439 [Chlorella variabilis]